MTTKSNTQGTPARPPFLTVLCFLTFVSAFSGLWRQSEQLWSPGRVAGQTQALLEKWMERVEEQMPKDESGEAALKLVENVAAGMTPERLQRSAIVMLIYESLTLFGAYFMYHLQRRGFYLYLGGVAAGIFGAMVFVGGLSGLVLTTGSLFFSLIFLLLYRLHLRYLH